MRGRMYVVELRVDFLGGGGAWYVRSVGACANVRDGLII